MRQKTNTKKLLQSVTVVYFKESQELQSMTDFAQSASSIGRCDSYYKMGRNIANFRTMKTVVSNEPNITFYKNVTTQKNYPELITQENKTN